MPDIVGSHNCSQVILPVALIPVETFGDIVDPQRIGKPFQLHVLNALVDTGAQGTCITRSAAKKLGLSPMGTVAIQGVSGIQYHNNYLFKVGFALIHTDEIGATSPNLHILDREIEGAEFDCGAHADFEVLLGMDVISTGTLTVSHNGSYRFTF